MADFGLTEDMYAANYFRHNEKVSGSEEKVPIKWMAPESIERSIYNEKTDVVSVFTCLFGKLEYILEVSPSVKVNTNLFITEEAHALSLTYNPFSV